MSEAKLSDESVKKIVGAQPAMKREEVGDRRGGWGLISQLFSRRRQTSEIAKQRCQSNAVQNSTFSVVRTHEISVRNLVRFSSCSRGSRVLMTSSRPLCNVSACTVALNFDFCGRLCRPFRARSIFAQGINQCVSSYPELLERKRCMRS